MYFVYVIQSKIDNRLYVGFTDNLERRIGEHNSGRTKSTKAYIPWELVYFESVENRIDARKREKYFKSGYGKEQLKRQISRT